MPPSDPVSKKSRTRQRGRKENKKRRVEQEGEKRKGKKKKKRREEERRGEEEERGAPALVFFSKNAFQTCANGSRTTRMPAERCCRIYIMSKGR